MGANFLGLVGIPENISKVRRSNDDWPGGMLNITGEPRIDGYRQEVSKVRVVYFLMSWLVNGLIHQYK